MSKRFGRQQKRKAVELARKHDCLKGRHCEVLAILDVVMSSLTDEQLVKIKQRDIGDRTVMFRGDYISLPKLHQLIGGA